MITPAVTDPSSAKFVLANVLINPNLRTKEIKATGIGDFLENTPGNFCSSITVWSPALGTHGLVIVQVSDAVFFPSWCLVVAAGGDAAVAFELVPFVVVVHPNLVLHTSIVAALVQQARCLVGVQKCWSTAILSCLLTRRALRVRAILLTAFVAWLMCINPFVASEFNGAVSFDFLFPFTKAAAVVFITTRFPRATRINATHLVLHRPSRWRSRCIRFAVGSDDCFRLTWGILFVRMDESPCRAALTVIVNGLSSLVSLMVKVFSTCCLAMRLAIARLVAVITVTGQSWCRVVCFRDFAFKSVG